MHAVDLAFLAFKGLFVASIPLTLIWIARGKNRHADKLQRLAWVTVFLTFDLVVFGGFTRLTNSGLGCPDWPGCYAKANPFAASVDIHAAEAAMPTGPVNMTKAWIEMVHRYLAMGVGVLIIVMMIWAWRRYLNRPQHVGGKDDMGRESPWLATALFGLVCLQGAFGAWTVTMKLQPVIVTTHLLLALLMLALLVWHAARFDRREFSAALISATPRLIAPGLRWLAWCGLIALTVQIALGGWVSTNYAVMACTDFPLCQGQLAPQMDFANGFHLWRELGKTANNTYLPFEALTAIHWAHRSFAWIAAAVLAALAWRLWGVATLRRYAGVLAALLVLQFTTGIINVVLSWPLLAAVLHNAGAAALLVDIVLINYALHSRVGFAHSAEPMRPESIPRPSATALQ